MKLKGQPRGTINRAQAVRVARDAGVKLPRVGYCRRLETGGREMCAIYDSAYGKVVYYIVGDKR